MKTPDYKEREQQMIDAGYDLPLIRSVGETLLKIGMVLIGAGAMELPDAISAYGSALTTMIGMLPEQKSRQACASAIASNLSNVVEEAAILLKQQREMENTKGSA